MSKIKKAFKKITDDFIPNEVKPILPAAASLIPGIGPVGASLIGAGIGTAVNGGLKGAAAGALGGFSGAGGGDGIGSFLGVGGTAGKALGRGLLGAASGGLTGGLKGALLSGALGAGSGYFAKPALNDIGLGEGGMFLDDGLNAGKSSSVWDNLGRIASGGYENGGGISNALSTIGSIYANKSAEDDLLNGQRRALESLKPYMNPEFKVEDFRTDPGYRFRLSEGQKALDRAASARGGYFSGAALKAAEDYGQGLADQTYQDAFERWLAEQGQGINVAGRAADVYENQGNIRANSSVNNSNIINAMLARALEQNRYNPLIIN